MTTIDRYRRAAGLALSILSATPLAAAAETRLFLTDGAAALGESGSICVSMNGGGGQVAGLQANLRWDDTCMTPTDARKLCRANSATGKNAQSALQGRGALKVILISFSDVNPIPDGNLFCCDFQAVGLEGTRCPPVQLEQIIGSTGKGERIDGIKAGNIGTFTVLGAGSGQGAPPQAAAGGSGPDTGAGQAPPPVAQFAPPGAVAEGASGSAAAAPGGAAAAGRAGPAAPGLPAQPRDLGAAPPVPPQYGDNVREAIDAGVPPAGVAEQPGRAGEATGAAASQPSATVGTTTPGVATATQAQKVEPTATPVPNTPTPLPPTKTPTPEDSGWLGGCEMRR